MKHPRAFVIIAILLTLTTHQTALSACWSPSKELPLIPQEFQFPSQFCIDLDVPFELGWNQNHPSVIRFSDGKNKQAAVLTQSTALNHEEWRIRFSPYFYEGSPLADCNLPRSTRLEVSLTLNSSAIFLKNPEKIRVMGYFRGHPCGSFGDGFTTLPLRYQLETGN